MKSYVLLTIGLFLVSAPAPDSGDIAEMTSNFIVPENRPGLSASETERSVVDGRSEARNEVGETPAHANDDTGEVDPALPQPRT